MTQSFPVILLPQPEGCYSQGETVEEALANIREAIEIALEDSATRGQAAPDAELPIITQVTVAA